MAGRLSPSEELLNSQEFRDSLFNTQPDFGDLFDEEMVAVSESTGQGTSGVETDAQTDCGIADQSFYVTQQYSERLSNQPKKRERFKFAQTKLLADYRFFLKTECTMELRALFPS